MKARRSAACQGTLRRLRSLRGLFLQDLREQYAAADEEGKKQVLRAARFGLAALDNRD